MKERIPLPGDSHEQENRLSVLLISSLLTSVFWSTALVELFAALLVITWLVHRISRRGVFGLAVNRRMQGVKTSRLALVCWLVYVIGVIISIVCSPVFSSSMGYLNKLWHALLFPIALDLAISSRNLMRLAKAFTISAFGVAALSIVLLVFQRRSDMQWPFVGDTTFAILLTLSWLVVLGGTAMQEYAEEQSRMNPPRVFADLAAGFPVVAAIFFSTMKAPVILVILGSCLIGLAFRSRVALFSIGILTLLSFISPHTLWMKVQWIASGNAIDRYIIWTSGKDLLAGMPLFGYGPDSYAWLLPASAKAVITHKLPSSWHNDFLQTILESGWITGIAYVACVGSVLYGALVVIRNRGDRRRRMELAVLAVVLVVLIAFSIVNAVISTAVLGATFWILLGLTANLTMKERS